jgi:antitoxin HicB
MSLIDTKNDTGYDVDFVSTKNRFTFVSKEEKYTSISNENWFAGEIDSPIHPNGKYKVFFEADAEDGGFVVTIPTLRGCITEADSFENAFEFIKDALEGWIAIAQEKGLEIPSPDVL